MDKICITVTLSVLHSSYLLNRFTGGFSQMRKWEILFAMLLIIPILNGCTSSSTQDENKEIDKIILTSFSDRSHEVTVNKPDLHKLQAFINNKKKMEGIINMTAPDYIVSAIYKDNREDKYHLWVGSKEETSAISEIDYTESLYTLSSEATQKIQELMKANES